MGVKVTTVWAVAFCTRECGTARRPIRKYVCSVVANARRACRPTVRPMNNHHNPSLLSAAEFPQVADRAFARVAAYRPRLLTDDQARVMLTDIKRVVLHCNPRSPEVAGNLLSTLCKFVADTAPGAGCALQSVLTDAKAKSWVSGRRLRDGDSRSLTEEAVRLRRLLRVQRGLPSVLGLKQDRRIAPPPLKDTELAELHRRCRDAGAPATRGFTAAFGAGVTGAAMVGARFINTGSGVVLRLTDGAVKPIVDRFRAPDLIEAVVHEGDWSEVVYLASKMRVYLQPANAAQTFREQALAEPASLAVLCRRYKLGQEAVNGTVDYLDPVDLHCDRAAAEALRGAPITEWLSVT